MAKAKRAKRIMSNKSAPNWKEWRRSTHITLHEGIYLSLGISPRRDGDRFGPDFQEVEDYMERLKAVQPEIRPGGSFRLKAQDIKPNKIETFVKGFLFVNFAREKWNDLPKEFLNLYSPQSDSSSAYKDLMSKKPVHFQNKWPKFVREIKERAEKAGETFDINACPGQKRDLFDLATRWEYFMSTASFATFITYIKGLCRFRAKQPRTDQYKKWFPELYKEQQK